MSLIPFLPDFLITVPLAFAAGVGYGRMKRRR
jgi:hypothetical protein